MGRDPSGELDGSHLSGSNEKPAWLERIVWTGVPPLARGVGRIVWRMEVDLESGLPDPPFVVAANHHSFLDPVLIGATLRHKIRFLALVDLFGNYRWLDFVLGAFDVIPLKRGVVPLGPVRAALAHLDEGGNVGLFPEGTRHWDFDQTRARPGAAWLAAQADAPLVPVAVAGTDAVLGVDNRLHAGRVRVMVGPPLLGTGTNRAAVDELSRRWGHWIDDRLHDS